MELEGLLQNQENQILQMLTEGKENRSQRHLVVPIRAIGKRETGVVIRRLEENLLSQDMKLQEVVTADHRQKALPHRLPEVVEAAAVARVIGEDNHESTKTSSFRTNDSFRPRMLHNPLDTGCSPPE